MDRQFLGVYKLHSADFPIFDPDDYEPINLARLAQAVAMVQGLANDPDALMQRAQRLRDGTAKAIDGLSWA